MKLLEAFTSAGIALSPLEEGLFAKLLSEFISYNSHTNLSAIRDEEGIIEKHFLDSAILTRFEKLQGRLLDIGTGGGFPGIPLKILCPELEVVLLDSVSKKTKACDVFIGALGLQNISTVWSRAEELAKKPNFAKSFQIITSRATAYMPDILTWAEPFLAKWGKIFLYKTPSEEELKDAEKVFKKLSLSVANIYEYELAGQKRKIFVIQKN